MKKNLIITMLFCLTLSCLAQNSKKIEVIKTLCNQSNLIVEGKGLEKGKSFRDNNNVIYTPYSVTVVNILKGQSKTKTIQVLVEGGQIEENGMGVGSNSSHGLNFLIEANSVIFCSSFNDSKLPNAYFLTEQICYTSKNIVVKTNYLSEQYNNINDFLSDLSTILKINIPQKKSEINNSTNSNDANNYGEYSNNYYTLIKKKTEQFLLSKNANKTTQSLAQSVNLQIANSSVTGTSTKYLEFDVNINSTNSLSYLDNMPVWITYNNSVFGTNVVSGGKVTITNGPNFNNTQYLPANSNKVDQTTNTFAFSVGTDFTLSNPTRVNITPSYILLAHVKIELTLCGIATANLSNASSAINAAFYTTTSNASSSAFVQYTSLTYAGSANVNPLCSINVTDFNTPVKGGKGDIVTIKGAFFGNTRGNGQVKFRDANPQGFPNIQKLDPIDYISWNDTMIKIKLPSMIQLSSINQVPGSGPFIVKNNLGDSTIAFTNALSQKFVVYYSLFEDYNPASMQKHRFYVKNANTLGGYTIRMDTSISNYPNRKGCVIKAIRDWRCLSGINLVLGNDTVNYPSTQDKITTLFFTPSLPVGVVASTQTQSEFCINSSNYTYAITDFDIKFSRQFNYVFDTSGTANLPDNYFDFYEAITNEIGHGIGLKHVIDSTQIMYRSTVQSATSTIFANQRKKLQIYTGDTDGEIDLISASSTAIFGQCVNFNTHQSSNTVCSQVGIEENRKNRNTFIAYPNPLNTEKLNLIFSEDITSIKKIYVHDSYGRIIYETINDEKQSKLSIDLANFSAGIYLINVNVNGNNYSQKIIKH